jgi:hypothetical protein
VHNGHQLALFTEHSDIALVYKTRELIRKAALARSSGELTSRVTQKPFEAELTQEVIQGMLHYAQ